MASPQQRVPGVPRPVTGTSGPRPATVPSCGSGGSGTRPRPQLPSGASGAAATPRSLPAPQPPAPPPGGGGSNGVQRVQPQSRSLQHALLALTGSANSSQQDLPAAQGPAPGLNRLGQLLRQAESLVSELRSELGAPPAAPSAPSSRGSGTGTIKSQSLLDGASPAPPTPRAVRQCEALARAVAQAAGELQQLLQQTGTAPHPPAALATPAAPVARPPEGQPGTARRWAGSPGSRFQSAAGSLLKPPGAGPQTPSYWSPAAPPADDYQTRVVCSLHLVLEALAFQTGAERATVALYSGPQTDELVTVATVGHQGLRKQAGRVPVSRCAAGSVFSTGIAVNQLVRGAPGTEAAAAAAAAVVSGYVPPPAAAPAAPPAAGGPAAAPAAAPAPAAAAPGAAAGAPPEEEQDTVSTDRVKSMLCFPVTGLSNPEIIGVVQLTNKRQGAENFTQDDEFVVWASCRVLAYLLRRYPVNWFGAHYDAAPLHSVVPWEPQGQTSRLLPLHIGTHGGRQLVYRSGQSGQYIRRRQLIERDQSASVLGPCATLKEVDSYVQNLESCWRRSVALNIDFEQQNEEKLMELRRMRDDVRGGAKEVQRLQEEMRVHTMEVDDYRHQYDNIRDDLRALLELKTNSRHDTDDPPRDSIAQRGPGERSFRSTAHAARLSRRMSKMSVGSA